VLNARLKYVGIFFKEGSGCLAVKKFNRAHYYDIMPHLRPLYTMPNCYIVGGSIRDMRLGRTTIDLDIIVAEVESAVEEIKAFTGAATVVLGQNEGFNCYRFNIGRVSSHSYDQAPEDSNASNYWFDLSELRNGKLKDDLSKRDFTINAMALPLQVFLDYISGSLSYSEMTAAIIDPHNGQVDLAKRKLRQLHDSLFLDDPLRLWRLWRLAAELAFEPAPGLLDLARRDCSKVVDTAGERVRNEIIMLLSHDNAAYYLACAADCGLLTAQFPVLKELKDCRQGDNNYEDVWQHSLRVVETCDFIIANLDYLWPENQCRLYFERWLKEGTNISILKFAALFHDIGKPETRIVGSDNRIHFYGHEKIGLKAARMSADKVRLSNKEKTLLNLLISKHLQIHDIINKANLRTKARFWRDHQDNVAGLILLGLADLMAKKGPRVDPRKIWLLVTQYIPEFVSIWLDQPEEVEKAMPLLDGNIIMNTFNLTQGELIGKVKDAVWLAQVEGRVNNKDEAMALAQEIIDQLL
jgi:poly(A) polymerase